MKKYIIAAMAIAASAALSEAGEPLDMANRALLRRQRAEQNGILNAAAPGKAPAMTPEGSRHTFVMIQIAEGYTAEDLEAAGVSVASVRGNIALASVPTDEVERVAAAGCVRRLEISRTHRPSMKAAREASGVAAAHEGLELDHPYTGKGVVAGIVDQGLDPNHINFRNGNGSSRIGYLSHIFANSSSQDGWTGNQYDRDNIYRFTTDTDETFHGTHTLGIMAGSYAGQSSVAVPAGLQLSETVETDNPFYGVATGADIAASCGELADMFIGLGVDRILDYRYYSEGNPRCVINLSLGSNTGSHNPNAMMSQFLDLAAQEAVIVVSAGNEGDIPLALIKTLTADDNEAKTFILPTYQAGTRYGQVYMYSDRPFKAAAVIYNKSRGRIAYTMPVADGQEEGVPQYYASTDAAESGDITSQQFTNAFKGYCGIGWFNEEYTEEYVTLMDFYTVDNTQTNAAGNYILGFVVTGEPGQRVECYCDASFVQLDDYDQAGWDDGMTDGSISDMACGKEVIVVGSYNTSDDFAALDGRMYSYGGAFEPGKVTPFSSYGSLADGRTLPHVCAPGAAVVSSTNHYYVANRDNHVPKGELCAETVEADRTNYWMPATGTSMASPYVAGSIALWLEANPTLTTAEIKDIIATTAIRDKDVLEGNPVQWGAGKFDAYAGLKEAVRRAAGISSATTDDNTVMVAGDGRVFEFFLGGAQAMDVTLYTTAGQTAMHAAGSGDTLSVDTGALGSGIYVARVNGHYTKRIIVK